MTFLVSIFGLILVPQQPATAVVFGMSFEKCFSFMVFFVCGEFLVSVDL